MTAFHVLLRRETGEIATVRVECDSADEAETVALVLAESDKPNALDWTVADFGPPHVIQVEEAAE